MKCENFMMLYSSEITREIKKPKGVQPSPIVCFRNDPCHLVPSFQELPVVNGEPYTLQEYLSLTYCLAVIIMFQII